MIWKLRRTLLAATLGASLVASSSLTPVGAVEGDPLESALLLIDEARRFRTELGLDTDQALLEELAATTSRSPTFGLPLLPNEEALLQERVRIQSEMGAVKEYQQAHRDVFAGLWLSYPRNASLDHATTVNVAVTDDPASHAGAVSKLLPQGADLAMHQALYSEKDLESLHSDIFDNRAFFKSLGTELYSAFTIVQRNEVEVVVSNVTPEIESAILARFPSEMVSVQPGEPARGDACSRTNCGPPWRGGLKIYRGGNGCTAGYVAKKYVGVWTYQLWTAGHCGTGTWHLGSATGPTIGTTPVNYFASNSIDVQGVGIGSSVIDDDYLYGTSGCTNCVQTDIASVEPLNGDIIGAMVRNNGAFSGSKSGTLAATNGSIDYLGEHLTNLRRASYSRTEGDSGAPVIRISNGQYGSYNVAAGAHTHYQEISGTIWAMYTHVGYYKNWTGYEIHTSGD